MNTTLMLATLALLLASPAAAGEGPGGSLWARAVYWDVSYRPSSQNEWIQRLESEVQDALKNGIDVLLFPELIAWGLAPYKNTGEESPIYITRVWNKQVLPRVSRKLLGKNALVVLGSYPHQEKDWTHAFNRATIWHEGAWRFADKLDPTQLEALESPPIKPGDTLPLFRFKDGVAAVLTCFSIEKPEIAAKLKAEGVSLVLVPSATADERGISRVLRSASGRAVELGAAVLVAPLTGTLPEWPNQGLAAMYLPDQEGLDETRQEGPKQSAGFHRKDFEIPWRKVLALRAQGEKPEIRPFLAPTPQFSVAK